ncbi:MAG: ABC transporter permease [Thermoanaerobaculia bacterium]
MSASVASVVRDLPRIYWLETKYELLKTLRLPAYVVPTIAFPLVFYVFFGIGFGNGKMAGAVNLATYLIASYGTFGVMGASLFGLGAGVAVERGQGWMQVKRTTPMPLGAYFTAKIALAVLFSGIIAVLLFSLGFLFAGVRLAPAAWPLLLLVLLLGAIPFCALGLIVGYLAGPNSAPAVVNLIHLPLAFASGLWIPLEALPRFFQGLAPFLPPYHLAQLALSVVSRGAMGGSVLQHVAALAGFTALFLLVAFAAFRKDEGKTYG